MAAPLVRYWQITDPGDGQIAHFGSSGPTGTELNPAALDFGPVEAGQWGTPVVLLVAFDGNSASRLSFKVYDTSPAGQGGGPDPVITSLGENIFQTTNQGDPLSFWNFRIDLKKSYVAPSTIDLMTVASGWDTLLWNTNPYDIDNSSRRPRPGNDNDSSNPYNHLLTPIAGSNPQRYVTNFFLYLTARPRTDAIAGEHVGWGFRLSYIYPNV